MKIRKKRRKRGTKKERNMKKEEKGQEIKKETREDSFGCGITDFKCEKIMVAVKRQTE